MPYYMQIALILTAAFVIIVGWYVWGFIAPIVRRNRAFKECARIQEIKRQRRWPN